ncbi:hypothetical protein SAMN04488029_3405 [Reichenbachiella faecimaris]|uniref:Uncharacterized protein n=1 Tax=Reichenbachiella faecimaris TaxID=692418 RepID=A0A1W2GM87_REIFA|nr:hypothetical protein [Reichenbachiella faecimaris]SMD37674.1 hypothetical protein SAMN04488029_3405 [Reichenbachiella faecimaris]
MPYLFKSFNQLTRDAIGKDCLEGKLKEEVTAIIQIIDRELFAMQSQTQAEFYIQKVELAIANYEFSIKNDLQSNDSIARAKNLQYCLSSLDTIRHHLETTYSVYRDGTRPVSLKTRLQVSKDIKVKEERLEALLDKNKITRKLKGVILHPIQNITSTSNGEVSQQRVEYLTIFIDELIQFLESLQQVEEQQLLQYLYVLNFNNIALLCYICEHYKNLKGEIDDERSLLDHLYHSKNQLNSIPQSTRRPYNVDMNDLKVQVQTWIQEEIVNVKKAIKKNAKEKSEGNGTKLKFNYSVEVVSGFFRLLHDAGVINTGANQTVRWITQNISSKNQPSISQQSIQRKFFEKHSNKEPLKDIVIHLLNHLNRK